MRGEISDMVWMGHFDRQPVPGNNKLTATIGTVHTCTIKEI